MRASGRLQPLHIANSFFIRQLDRVVELIKYRENLTVIPILITQDA